MGGGSGWGGHIYTYGLLNLCTAKSITIQKGVHQGCIFPHYLFNSYAQYIIRNARVVESQAGIKIAWRNINNLRDADDTTIMAESEEELKSLWMKVKEENEKLV